MAVNSAYPNIFRNVLTLAMLKLINTSDLVLKVNQARFRSPAIWLYAKLFTHTQNLLFL